MFFGTLILLKNGNYTNNLGRLLPACSWTKTNLKTPQWEIFAIKEKKKCLQDIEGPQSTWTTTNCKTKLRKMSSITSVFTFSLQFIFLKRACIENPVVAQRKGKNGVASSWKQWKIASLLQACTHFLAHSFWNFLEASFILNEETQPLMISHGSVSSVCGGFILYYFCDWVL